MNLNQIGFYTMSEQRAATASEFTKLTRCELLLGSRCNFNCKYCRHIGGSDISTKLGVETISRWAKHNLFAVRFSGGEPTLHKDLPFFVSLSRQLGVNRIAISTNGSASRELYDELMDCGVNDFSISLDACCAADGAYMAGTSRDQWHKVIDNIKYISNVCYVTVGVVLTDDNAKHVNEIIDFAAEMKVSDIRIIPAAQDGNFLAVIRPKQRTLDLNPILNYRIMNMGAGLPVRGLKQTDSMRCGLVLDDIAVCQDEHYPCIIYMREGGKPIGKVSDNMRPERAAWYESHNTLNDPICRRNCLDVCKQYNNTFQETNPRAIRF